MLVRLIIMSLLLLSTGCASIINGTTQNIPVTSSPSGAKVCAVGGDKKTECITPGTLTLKRKYDQNVTIELEGYKPQTVQIKSVLSGAVAGNILAGGLIGWGVDAASGGDSKLVPEAISVTLEEDKKKAELLADNQSNPSSSSTKASALDEELAKLAKMREDGKITEKEEQSLRKKAMDRF